MKSARNEQLDEILSAAGKIEFRTGRKFVLDPEKLSEFLGAAPTTPNEAAETRVRRFRRSTVGVN